MFILVAVCLSLLATSSFAKEIKGLNVMLTSKVEETQMMAMVLSMMTLKQGKKINMVLCSDAGVLAEKGD